MQTLTRSLVRAENEIFTAGKAIARLEGENVALVETLQRAANHLSFIQSSVPLDPSAAEMVEAALSDIQKTFKLSAPASNR